MTETEGSRIAVLETKMDFLVEELSETRQDLKALTRMLNQVQGGWRVLAFFASIGGAIMGFFGSWVLKKFGG